MFAGMLNQLRETVSRVLSHVEVRVQRPEDLPTQPPQRIRASHPEPASALAAAGPRTGGDAGRGRSRRSRLRSAAA